MRPLNIILSFGVLTAANENGALAFFSPPSSQHGIKPKRKFDFQLAWFHRRTSSALFLREKNDAHSIAKNAGLLSRRNILKYLSGTVLGIPLLLEAYSRSGSVQTAVDIFQQPDSGAATVDSDVTDITIIFHGAGGEDDNTENLLKVLSSKIHTRTKGIVKMVNWSSDSENILQASVKGSKIGSQIGRLVRDVIQNNGPNEQRNIHVVGISVGAFAADALVQTLDSELEPSARKSIYLQLTLLDPFQQKAVLGLNFGKNNFGKGADYAQQYLNTDDPVPSTSEPLQHCSTIDVTSLRPIEVFGHDWPLVYYTQQLKDGNEDAIVPPERRGKIGSLQVL